MTKGAKLLKQKRTEHQLTQLDVERSTGIPRSTIACIETVKDYTTSIYTARVLASFFSFDWYLFFEEEEEGDDEQCC